MSSLFVAVDRVFDPAQHYNASGKNFEDVLFNTLPSLGRALMSDKLFCIILVISYVFKTIGLVYFAWDLSLLYGLKRKSSAASFGSLPPRAVGRFLVLETVVYLAFGSVAMVIYTLGRQIWSAGYGGGAGLIVISFLVLYPCFYASLSVSTLFSVLPWALRDSLKKMTAFTKWPSIGRTYIFYGVRSLLDFCALAVVSLIMLRLRIDAILQFFLVCICLSVPLAFSRTSSFAFKLTILADDWEVRRMFGVF